MEEYCHSTLISKLRASQAKALENWNSEADTFVPFRASVSAFSKEDFDLDEEIEKFLLSDKKVMLLLGDSGSGKSLYTQGFVTKKWRDYRPKNIIPLWISLSSLKDPTKQAIEETLRNAGFNEQEIITLREENQFLFVFDGYDEIRQFKNLIVTNRVERWQSHSIITCRREYLYHIDDYALHFMPFIKERAVHSAFVERVIKPFNIAQIDYYLQQQVARSDTVWSDWQRYRLGIDEIPGLSELLSSPTMLKHSIFILPIIFERYQGTGDERIQMTQTAIYDALIEQWFERQQTKLKLACEILEEEDKKPAFWSFAKALACAMHEANITVVHYESESSLFDEEVNPWTRFFMPEDKQLALLQTACLAREVSPKKYALVHSSLLLYFLSRHLYEDIFIPGLSTGGLSQESTDSQSLEFISATSAPEKSSDETSYFNRCLFVQDNETIQFSADKISEGAEGLALKQRYFSLIKASKNNPAMGIAASNAISILKRAGVSFSGEDFQDTHFIQPELEGGIFHGTDFRRAHILGANLNKAYLAKANFEDADVTGSKFGQLPSHVFNNFTRSLAYSPDGELFAVAVVNTGINIFKTGEFDCLVQCKKAGETESTINCIVFSGDSQQIISGHVDGKLRLWDAKTGDLVREIEGHTAEINCIAYQAESNRLISGSSDNTLRQWSAKTWKCLSVSRGHADKVTVIAIHPNGKRFVSGSEDKTLRLWSNETGDQITILELDKSTVTSLAFNGRDGRLASCETNKSGEGHVKQWLITSDSFTLIREQKRENEPYCVVYSPDGVHLLVGGFGCLEQFSVETGVLIHTYQGRLQRKATSLAYNPDGTEISALGNTDSRVCQWPVLSKAQTSINADQLPIGWIALNPLRPEFVTDGWGGKIRRWDAETGTLISIYSSLKEMWKVVYSYDAQYIASCGTKGRIEIINLKSGKRALLIQEQDELITSVSVSEKEEGPDKIITSPGVLGSIFSIAFSSDTQRLAIGTQNKIIQFAAKTGELLVISEGHQNIVQHLEYCRNNQWFISGSFDQTIRKWDTVTGQSLMVIDTHSVGLNLIALSPDNLRIASGSCNGIVEEWNVNTGELQRTLHCKDAVLCVAYHPTKSWIIASCMDGSIYVWDISNDKNHNRLALLQDSQKASKVVINADGDIISGGYSGALSYWKCDLTLQKPRWLLKWSTLSCQSLVLRGSRFEQTQGLTVKDQLLVSQLGAHGIHSKIQENISNTRLHEAILEDDLELFEYLLSQDIDILAEDKDGYSTLSLAINCSRVEMVKDLLSRGVKLSTLDRDGRNFLHRAANSGNNEVIRLLLAYGAEIDALDKEGLTAVHWAAFNGHVRCVEFLLDAGANIHIISTIGLTVLHNAAKSGNSDCLRLILARCTELINVQTQGGWTPLHFAVENHRAENQVVEIISRHGLDIDMRKKVLGENKTLIQLLLDHGADTDAQDHDGLTPLHYAVFKGFPEIVEILLEGGAKTNIVTNIGLTVLHNAAKSGNTDCLSLLLTRCSDLINAKCENGWTPLHFAVDNKHNACIKLLLEHGAEVDALDNEGLTPLHWAAIKGFRKTAELLLESGANTKIVSNIGLTVLQNAVRSGDSDCLTFFLSLCPEQINYIDNDGWTPLRFATENADINSIIILLAEGAGIDISDNKGCTPLHCAAVKGFRATLDILLERGANIDIKTHEGTTILNNAASSGDVDSLTFLLARCPEQINLGDNDGWTPLHFASTQSAETVSVILSQGTDIHAVNQLGNTALHIAAWNNQPEVIILLLSHSASIDQPNKSGETALHHAVLKGASAVVEMLLAHNANIEAKDNSNCTPMHFAANNNQSECLSTMLAHGADINPHSKSGQTPLHRAVSQGFPEIVKLLLMNEADIEATDNDGDTPLHFAAYEKVEIAEILLTHKASLNVLNKDGWSPLHNAYWKGNRKIIDMMVEHGADIHTKISVGNSLLHATALGGQEELARTLLLDGHPMNPNKFDRTPLHIGAREGHENIVRLFLEHKASVNDQDDEGLTPLHYAALKGSCVIIELLLDGGADPKIVSKLGLTILHNAAKSGDPDSLTLLLTRCLEQINTPDNAGGTPLHFSTLSGHDACIKILLAHGANMDARDANEGFTPLHVAGFKGFHSTASLLLEAGSKTNIVSKSGISVLHTAANGGNSDCLNLLLTRCSDQINWVDNDSCTPLRYAVNKGDIACIKILVEQGSDVDAQDNEGVTCLHIAAYQSNCDATQYLLESGANKKIRTKAGWTVLHHAAAGGNEACFTLLLTQSSEDIHSVDKEGYTPLHIAADNGHKNIIGILLSEDTEIDAQDNQGLTPLHWAAFKGHFGATEYLLKSGAKFNIKGKTGWTVLHTAAAGGNEACFKYLLQFCLEQITWGDHDGLTPLHWAAQNNSEAVVKILLEHGADPSTTTTAGDTALILAEKAGHQNIVSLLANLGQMDKSDASYQDQPLPQAATDFFKPPRRTSAVLEDEKAEDKNASEIVIDLLTPPDSSVSRQITSEEYPAGTSLEM